MRNVLPFLAFIACPLMMVLFMRGMRRGEHADASCRGGHASKSDETRQREEIVALRDEIAVLRAELERTSEPDGVAKPI